MANQAGFSSSLTYTPGLGGTLTQNFNVTAEYTAISAGKLDVPTGSTTAVTIPFGSVSDARGLIVQNGLDVAVSVSLGAGNNLYHLPPGGVVMHWAPRVSPAVGTPLGAAAVTPVAGPTVEGSIDYVVLGQ